MVRLFCEEETLVEGNEVLDDEELVEGKKLLDTTVVEETTEDDIEAGIVASHDVICDVDEVNNDESFEVRLGKGFEVHPVKIPVTQVNKMMG